MRPLARGAASLGAIALGFAAAGCPFMKTSTTVRVDAHQVTWTDLDLEPLASGGTAWGFEFAPCDDSQSAMGPMYIGGAYSRAVLDDDSVEQRAGVRARSSMLDHSSASFPYAAVGVYLGWLEPTGRYSRIGMGVEGGFGLRLGMGRHAGLDLEAIFSYGYYASAFQAQCLRLGGGLFIGF